MCLAIPGKIIEIYEEDGLRMGKLDFGGLVRKACLQYIPEAEVGHYALIHVGFALAKIEADEAARATRPWTIMEVCGGQTHSIVKHGIDYLLPG